MGRKREQGEQPDLSTLLGEVLHRAEELVHQQVNLLKSETRQEVRRTAVAAAAIGTGAGLVAAGGVLSTLMLVHGLHKATRLPLWSCYGLVGGLLAATGTGFMAAGRKEVADLQWPPPQTVAALKENLVWLREEVRLLKPG